MNNYIELKRQYDESNSEKPFEFTIDEVFQAADKEIATRDEQNRLTCCAIADMTPASEYSDAIEDAMSEWDAVKIARLVIAEYKFKLDCEAARIATKDAELARLRGAINESIGDAVSIVNMSKDENVRIKAAVLADHLIALTNPPDL